LEYWPLMMLADVSTVASTIDVYIPCDFTLDLQCLFNL